MPEWSDIVGGMIERFGKDPATVNILLGFLKALVEEVGNPRLVVSVSRTVVRGGSSLIPRIWTV
jgi:hypothetical protein